MLRGNLSTRPFYNERLVGLALLLALVAAIGLTLFNVSKLVSLSAERRRLTASTAADDNEAARVSAAADREQKSVNQANLRLLAVSTREANELIDQRMFSWTIFFGLLEKTMPLNVRLVAVSPHLDKGEFKVTMTVIAKDLSDIDDFIQALYATGAFYDAYPSDKQAKDDGSFAAAVETSYLEPGATHPKAPKKPGGDGKGNRP